MKNDPTSLENLHDIVVPDPIPWWPPAPGWIILAGLVVLASFYLWCRAVAHWRANAYRRAALRELEAAESVTSISELLRRTSLAIAPRTEIAAQSGSSWPEWLQRTSPNAMPDEVYQQLTDGSYRDSTDLVQVAALKSYASDWIRQHRYPLPQSDPTPTRT